METENVTMKVPTNLLRLLEEKNYFGKTKDESFTNYVKQGIDGELNKLNDTKEIRRLEDKYGLAVELSLENAQNQDPAFEVPLTPEQYATMRAWIDAKDLIEIVTGPGEGKATVFNSQQLWRKNHRNCYPVAVGEPVQLKITVMSPFIDFIKEYMRFFGCKYDLEIFCMKAVYARVQSLNGDLEKFAGTHGLDTSDWLERFNERTHGSDLDEENDC